MILVNSKQVGGLLVSVLSRIGITCYNDGLIFFILFIRPSDGYFNALYFNDPNLNPGFDLNAFRIDQLNLHNHYRRIHRVPQMSLDPK